MLPPNADYGFALDGSDPSPTLDRIGSRWACRARHASSITTASSGPIDRWTGVHLPASVIYELHVGTFSTAGTFDGVIEHLDHLVALGVDVIEVMPVAAFDGGRGWGYDGVAPYAVHEPYGGPEGFKRLVDAAHARGIGVLLDVVYNHFGPTGNYLNRFGPYTTDRHQTPWGDAVNLDGPDSAPVRRFLLDNARHWLTNYHLDGLRLDAVHALVDESDRHFLAELAGGDGRARRAPRPAAVARGRVSPHRAERRDGTRSRRTRPRRRMARRGASRGARVAHRRARRLLRRLRSGHHARRGALIGPKKNLPRSRFVVCAQNHDQVGNRARGDRLCHLVDIGLAKAAAALIICSPFVPLLFMGEEWAASSPFPYFAGPRNDELDEAVRRGRIDEFAAFGWDPDDIPDPIAASTFDSARLRWDEVDEKAHARCTRGTAPSIALRKTRPELSDPRPSSTVVDEHDSEHAVVMWRGSTAIAVNTDTSPLRLSLDGPQGRRVLLASHSDVRFSEDGLVVLPPHSVAIIG